jgi:transcription elongation factor Elf1
MLPNRIDITCPACKTAQPPIEAGQPILTCPACGKEMTAYEAGMQEVRAYIRWVRMVDAIRCYRKTTGADLGTAKNAVTVMWHSGDW